jgi:hypothetical protein
MRNPAYGLLSIAGLLAASVGCAAAAPPASCASKFVGTWTYSGGTTVIAPGGTAFPKCPMCVPTQTWTCNGNTYLFSNSGTPGEFSATLSPDGRTLTGSTGIVATRVGGASRVRAVAGAASEGSVAASPESAPKKKHADKTRRTRPQDDVAAAPPRAIATQASNCSQAEVHWKSAESMKTAEVYEDHLKRFPSCSFAGLAKMKIEALKK